MVSEWTITELVVKAAITLAGLFIFGAAAYIAGFIEGAGCQVKKIDFTKIKILKWLISPN